MSAATMVMVGKRKVKGSNGPEGPKMSRPTLESGP